MRSMKVILYFFGIILAVQAKAVTNEQILQSMAGKYVLIPDSVKVIGYSALDSNPERGCRPRFMIDVRTLDHDERGLRIYSQGDGETGSFIEFTLWDLKTENPPSFEDRSGGVLYHWNVTKTDIGMQFIIKVMSDEGLPDSQVICQYKRIQ